MCGGSQTIPSLGVSTAVVYHQSNRMVLSRTVGLVRGVNRGLGKGRSDDRENYLLP